ncbi:hypothetical protein ACR9EG_13050, partial [Lactococcus lactis]|uniref:hypothetical protein n=2 Tax=Bacillati TaxID=1783272 RepID=UPI003EC12929
TYSPEGVSNRTLVPDVPLAKPAGVDEAYSYCEKTDFVILPVRCTAVLARGNLLATITAMGADQDAVMEQLRSALPIFVEPFVKA